MHGPYHLELITAETFVQIDRVEAVEALRYWIELCDPVPPDQVEGDLAEVITHIDQADSRYRLPDLGERAQHMFGWVLGDFLELILINRSTDELRLVVASSD